MKDFIPRKDSLFQKWLENFLMKIEPEHKRLGLTDTDLEDIKEYISSYTHILKIIGEMKLKSKELTEFKNKLRNGKQIKIPLPAPLIEIKTGLSGSVYPGIEKKIRNYVKRIKAHPEYTDKLGKELKII